MCAPSFTVAAAAAGGGVACGPRSPRALSLCCGPFHCVVGPTLRGQGPIHGRWASTCFGRAWPLLNEILKGQMTSGTMARAVSATAYKVSYHHTHIYDASVQLSPDNLFLVLSFIWDEYVIWWQYCGGFMDIVGVDLLTCCTSRVRMHPYWRLPPVFVDWVHTMKYEPLWACTEPPGSTI